MLLSKMIKDELIMLLPRVLIFDGIVYLISLIFLGINYDMALGLFLGTIVMFSNFTLVGISTENSVIRYKITKSVKKAKITMLSYYFLRYIIVGLAVYISFSLKFGFLFNTFGVVIPLIYPKLIYVLQSIFYKKRKGD